MKNINWVKISIAGTIAILGLTACSPKQNSSAQMAPMVSVAKPIVGTVTNWDEYPGRFDSVEFVEIRPRVSGYIESIHFQDGAEVKAGDLLFIIDPKPFEAELARANAELARAKASLEQARANKTQAGTRLELANNDLKRAESLRAAKAISEEEYDLRSKTFREATAAVEAANAAVSAAESAVHSAQSAVRLAELNLEYTRITAPINGRIGRRLVTVGNLVQGGGAAPGTVLATLVSLDPIYCYFDVPERSYLKYRKLAISKDGKLVLPCEAALDGEEGFPHKGTIDFTDNKIDSTSGTIKLRGVFENKDRSLISGAFARIRLPIEKFDSTLLIPEGAILSEQTRKYVYVVNKDQTIAPRVLTLGIQQGMQRVVVGGLSPEDDIVVSGLLMLRPGIKVQVVDPNQPAQMPGMGQQPQGQTKQHAADSQQQAAQGAPQGSANPKK
ncbi:MAG: efflux RND transporter periplasmic adaptor subunit [Verrucomicrobiae bacterium]|nr:efflux RND transporter periplasmic adaptor subunit [Verrucomicrobiae bacterium]